ncbi:MFS general substrate transporter [Apiospora kogelbergensis]|uniref:MFS general substrate transporter n=1 Tax=Apiospora kogelbergensis TaxID=1337665 RepID=A0AAW0R2H8_9PEZI
MDGETDPLLADRSEVYWVSWDGPDDPQNPLNWEQRKKWAHVTSLSVLTFLVALGATMIVPAVPQIIEHFNVHSRVLGPLVTSIYVLGWIMGPMILAPLSETSGRLPVYTWTSALYLLSTVACAWSPSVGFLIISRFVAGSVGSASLTITGGTISDLIPLQQRGLALSLYMLGPILGPSVGPPLGGLLVDTWGWRSVFWAMAVVFTCSTLAQVAILRETYASVILAQNASHLQSTNRLQGNSAVWKSELDDGLSSSQAMRRAAVRPVTLTLKSPVNLYLSLVSAYVNGALFLLVTTLPLVLREEYHFSAKAVGFAFEGVGIGNLVGLGVFATTSDRYIRARRQKGVLTPEDRLVPMVAAGPMLCLGFFAYGWTAQLHAHWVWPIMSTGLIGMGNVLFFSAVISYLVDAFTVHSASAIAANIIIRSLGGTLLPLAGDQLYTSLGWGKGSSVLALIALLLTPGLLFLYTHGKRLRERFRFVL